ncbi:MAG: VOC family protein [Phenylobacterium sp.]|jgi:catechol 2,3-dioxygenase-like lactoylglutathione lyase family enzyme|uniref:VOC family protein n=1 Tax=Phenylobacterium sp. TaxID=1871053 RepID=UPI002A2B48D1|nr:VOC family protein [Phenylobacterium sp.]MDD3837890.1 VOC family protein [Phenylobacterium sp.]MDX9998656.1 VOC family protein [Phenylobacterium sp.]
MLDHIGLSVRDVGAARAFYDRALGPIGIRLLHTVGAELTGGAEVLGYGDTRPFFWISQASEPTGYLHVAFTVGDRGLVDAFHTAALAAGGRDNGGPGLRPHYHPHYYGAFVLDPDGHNIEAVCHAPA